MSICDTRNDGLDMFFAPTRSQRGGNGGGRGCIWRSQKLVRVLSPLGLGKIEFR